MESADLSSFSKSRDKLIWDLTGESVAVEMEDGQIQEKREVFDDGAFEIRFVQIYGGYGRA